jgi:NhaA family Na+:H+ antiporter
MNSTTPIAPQLDAIATPRFLRPLEKFLHIEASSGVVLLGAVLGALVWANWPGSQSYQAAWHLPLGLQFGSFTFSQPLHFYINDALMSVFFLVVGLEIRREIHEGALASVSLAALPLAAAVGGIAVPAAIYLFFNHGGDLRQGWAVPTATDIAFAVGVLTLLGKRVPAQLRILLLAIAIIDDIGAILVIAFFYSSGIHIVGLGIAAVGVVLVKAFHYLGVRTALPYAIPGAIVWFGVLHAGVHPTIAGVVLGLLTPVTTLVDRKTLLDSATGLLHKLRDRFANPDRDPQQMVNSLHDLKTMQREMVPPVLRVQVALHPWVAFGIMPLFALANAGVVFDQAALQSLTSNTASIGIVLGLAIGKPVGILLASVLAVRVKMALLPDGVNYRGVLVIGCLAGIGFTMSIFISQLAFADELLLNTAKLAVLIASAAAALLGLTLGARLLRHPKSGER